MSKKYAMTVRITGLAIVQYDNCKSKSFDISREMDISEIISFIKKIEADSFGVNYYDGITLFHYVITPCNPFEFVEWVTRFYYSHNETHFGLKEGEWCRSSQGHIPVQTKDLITHFLGL